MGRDGVNKGHRTDKVGGERDYRRGDAGRRVAPKRDYVMTPAARIVGLTLELREFKRHRMIEYIFVNGLLSILYGALNLAS